jgi:hypothetical protein
MPAIWCFHVTGELPSGVAPIEEMQRLAIRNESAHWRRYNIGPGAHRPELRENVSGSTQAHVLLQGDETAAIGDAGYQGMEKRPDNAGKAVKWHVAMKRSKRKALPNNKPGRMMEKLKQLQASVRAKVEHPFHHQEPVPSSEDALSRLGQEHRTTFYFVRLCQSDTGWPAT